MEDEENYDEFGNYIGPELKEINYQQNNNQMEQQIEQDLDQQEQIEEIQKINQLQAKNQIILHEDKKYFPELEEVYPGAETMIQEEDIMPITEPIIKSVAIKEFSAEEKNVPETSFSFKFLEEMMYCQELIRNIAIVGNLHHGKTSLMDLFVKQTHPEKQILFKDKDFKLNEKKLFYCNTRQDEREREISLKSSPLSLILPDLKGKSFLFNLFDTPGHMNFSDEICNALRICDGAVLMIDSIEGVMMGTEKIINYLVQEQIQIVVVINKIDRLILELKIPPSDAYLKIKHILEEVNDIIQKAAFFKSDEEKQKLIISPILNNVAFSSTEYNIIFTLKSFSLKYQQEYPSMDAKKFCQILWGNFYYNNEEKRFQKKSTKQYNQRTFVQFILEPIYKLISRTISHELLELESMLFNNISVCLKQDQRKLDSKPLLKEVCKQFFGDTSGFVDMIVEHINNTRNGNQLKIQQYYTGLDNNIRNRLQKCDPNEMLFCQIVKMYCKNDGLSFGAFGRVFSGTLYANQSIKILGEKYNLIDEEDMQIKQIQQLYIYESQYLVPIDKIPAGNWFYADGIDQAIEKSATLCDSQNNENIEIMKPIKYIQNAVIKVAIEPFIPSELPKMLNGLRKIYKCYPQLKTQVEESGEHVLIGTGELYMDSLLYDLRQKFSNIEIKVSDPSVTFCETVIDTSSIKCYGETPNKKNKLTFLSGPLDKGLAEDIQNEKINLQMMPQQQIQQFFENKYGWDILASRNIWAFGPENNGPNAFINDCLPNETDYSLLQIAKDQIIKGFQWATKEGPLCEESVRNVKYKMIEATIANDNIYRGGGQIIFTTRRVCNSSFLMATPRLLEPMFITEIQCSAEALESLYTLLQRRRGHIISEVGKPGTPLYTVKANLPAIDYFGFETDLRIHTCGQAFCMTMFDNWTLVPGDPLDKNIQLKILEPSPAPHLAREFMLKTRRRKGLSEDVSILKFFDDVKLISLLKEREDFKQFA